VSKGFLEGYRTYDPYAEGFGSTSQWRRAFRKRMTREEAEEIIGKAPETAWAILGVSQRATWGEVRAAYRRKAMELHPDRATANGMTVEQATEATKKLNAAYTILRERTGHAKAI